MLIIRQLPQGSCSSMLFFKTSSKLPMPKTSPRQSTAPKSVFKYKFFRLAHSSGVNSSGKSVLGRCVGCKSAKALCIRIKFGSVNRQQMSTTLVSRVTPCAAAANPPTRTNSTSAAINRRVNSLKFCIPLFHGLAQRFRKIYGIVVRLHPFPWRHAQTICQQR